MPLRIYVCKTCGRVEQKFDDELVDGVPVVTNVDGHVCDWETEDGVHVVGCTKAYHSPHRLWDARHKRNAELGKVQIELDKEKKAYAYQDYLKR
jgi:hypothetical protein